MPSPVRVPGKLTLRRCEAAAAEGRWLFWMPGKPVAAPCPTCWMTCCSREKNNLPANLTLRQQETRRCYRVNAQVQHCLTVGTWQVSSAAQHLPVRPAAAVLAEDGSASASSMSSSSGPPPSACFSESRGRDSAHRKYSCCIQKHAHVEGDVQGLRLLLAIGQQGQLKQPPGGLIPCRRMKALGTW